MKVFPTVLLVVLALPSPANAGDPRWMFTAGQAMAMCDWLPAGTTAAAAPSETGCNQRILGTIDGVLAGEARAGHPKICLSPYTGWLERKSVVEKYIRDHPESMSADLGLVIGAALEDAFPCHPRDRMK